MLLCPILPSHTVHAEGLDNVNGQHFTSAWFVTVSVRSSLDDPASGLGQRKETENCDVNH